jgi:hypothetical protein
MSELTSCNYCNLARIKGRAKKVGKKVVLKESKFMGGTDVFVVPEYFTLPDYKEPNEELPNGCEVYQKYHASWMMGISKQCCC